MESPRLVRVELLVGGMTCAACAAKVENKLNALENVSATVNYATEKATVTAPVSVPVRRFVEEIQRAGYAAEVAAADTGQADAGGGRPLPHPAGFTALLGLGARGVVDGHAVIVGREKLFRDRGLDISAELAAPGAAWERAGHTVVLAGWDGQVRGAIAVADTGDNPPGDGSQPEEQAASCLE